MLLQTKFTRLQIAIFGLLSAQIIFTLITSTAASDESSSLTTDPQLRLPNTTIPIKYHLHIFTQIDQEVLEYKGNVTIDLSVKQSTKEIVLHAKLLRDFKVNLIDLLNSSYQQFESLKWVHENETDFLRISSPIELKLGQQYRLEILFTGDIRLQNFGFYRTTYLDEENNTIPLASTQFEPTSARLAFPCFDEPSFKATFVISITHGSTYSALSNMPVDGKLIPGSNGEMTTTTFQETPVMSTYLIAFVVSNYEHISEFVNGIDHRVFFPPRSKDQGKKALKNAIASVTALENYLGIKYPLPKLDHIRLDKTYGLAMENWGLITYNTKNLLSAFEGGSARQTTIKMTNVQNHEIAHQWFGNLVSPKWWTYAWLNEGFATYFGYITTELVHPEWKIMELFIQKEVDVIIHWPITHAMTQYVEKEADIKSTFDVVCYQKSASVIKMFHHAIGLKTFIKGVAFYLNKFQYSVADENDLYGALQTVIDEDEQNVFKYSDKISSIWRSWTVNAGIPIVTVTRNYDNGTITFRQRSNSKHHSHERWWIPLSFATASNPNFDQTEADIILPPHKELTLHINDINLNITNNEWLIVNKQQTGLFFVVYDDRNYGLIADQLNTDYQKIHMFNRALLFRDLTEFTDRDISDMNALLSALQYLKYEQDLMPWNTASDFILELLSKLYGSSALEMFKSFIRDIVGEIYQRIRRLPETAIDSITRSKVIEVACKVDLTDCLSYTEALAKEYFYNGQDIETAVRDIALCQGVKYISTKEFQNLLEKMTAPNVSAEDYDDIIYAIRCVESKESLKYFLNFMLGENSTHEAMTEFEKMQYVSFFYVSNYFSRPVIMEFLRDNYKTLFKTSSVVEYSLTRICNYVSEEGGQKEEFLKLLADIKEYFRDAPKTEDLKIGSRIRQIEHFKKKHEESISVWLSNYERSNRKARSAASSKIRPSLTAARYIVAAGFISKLIMISATKAWNERYGTSSLKNISKVVRIESAVAQGAYWSSFLRLWQSILIEFHIKLVAEIKNFHFEFCFSATNMANHKQLILAATILLAIGGSIVQSSTIKRIPPLFQDHERRSLWEDIQDIKVKADEPDYRLPNNTYPLTYGVELTTKIKSGDLNFQGVVTIKIRVDEADTNKVVVHARQLEIGEAKLIDDAGKSTALTNSYAADTEFLTLTTSDNLVLVKGKIYDVVINYKGKLREDNGGFYVSTYLNKDKEVVYLATTQFESTDARHAFPCYDEPAKRANYTITINHDQSLNAISNMPVDVQKSSPGKTVFQETPKMPSYLVAFVVSDFESTSGSLNELTQRIFSRKGTQGDQEFALFAGIQITARLADYYGVPFTLPKLDQVAVPDFAAGAMENWGIATYREEYLLYNPKHSTLNTQTNIANIVAHEYTHMWFGDLVTPKWWTYLWLKEGFATLYSYQAADEVYPEWDIMQMFIVSEFQKGLSYDGGAKPRPMSHYVQKPNEIRSLYDSVSYSKAGAVLKMWEHAITDEIFKEGLNIYLNQHKFTGAEEDDLFDSIGKACKNANHEIPDTINLMMKTWTNQGGAPLLTVTRNYDDGSFTIKQTAFHTDDSVVDNKLWYIPVNYASKNKSDFRSTVAELYLKDQSAVIQGQIPANDWLILNKQSTGYYRVNYDEKNWQLITQSLIENPFKIHTLNRASLLYDAYTLSSTAHLKHEVILGLTLFLKNEDQYAPWSTANTILTTFNRFLSGDKEYPVFRKYVADVVGNIYNRLGVQYYTGEQHFTNNVRTIAINLACIAGVQSCLEDSFDKLTELVANNVEIEPNLQSVVYCNGLKKGGSAEFDYVYNRLMNSVDQAERKTLISALGCSHDLVLLSRFVQTSIKETPDVTLRVQERITLLSSAYSRGELGLFACIDFLHDNYNEYAELTSGFGGTNPLDSDIRGMSSYVVNANQEARLLELVEKVKNHPAVSTNLEAQVKANIMANFDWLNDNRQPVMKWVVEHYKDSAASISIVPAVMALCYAIVRLF
ncbi:uncharacterized protein LOC129913294 [Episyrphus balteatus]|uniref:uncharacterized protein LOC129913294 n=1 Tax=Episyrphus balteatus TaxID=286459 RepID=UPI0024854E50|nr:uncharacterized protein LOC129913294 [Episyrphus balteatus]